MYDLQSRDPETWDIFFNGNFSVSKSLVLFCSIGVDRELEQENKSMKNSGLEEHFLISCEMSQITEAFLESFIGIWPK